MAGRSELTLEEFKARLPLVEIVGRYVRLTKAGRDHKGLCPFHKEKTPSFHVVAEKGFYHCFGCGAHGTALDFVMGVEGLDLPGAIDRLAELTGIPGPRRRGGRPAGPGRHRPPLRREHRRERLVRAPARAGAGRRGARLPRAARGRPGDGPHASASATRRTTGRR